MSVDGRDGAPALSRFSLDASGPAQSASPRWACCPTATAASVDMSGRRDRDARSFGTLRSSRRRSSPMRFHWRTSRLT